MNNLNMTQPITMKSKEHRKLLIIMRWCCIFAVEHNKNQTAVGVFQAIPSESECTHWRSRYSKASEWSFGSHNTWRKWLCKQLLFGPGLSSLSPIFSPWLCCLYHLRVSQNPSGNWQLLSLVFFHLIQSVVFLFSSFFGRNLL